MRTIIISFLIAALMSCEPQIPTGHSEGINTTAELNLQYKILMYKNGDKHNPFNPPLWVNIQDSIIVMTNKTTILNRFYLVKPIIKDFEKVENGVTKVFNIALYKCVFPSYLGINEDIYAIGTKYRVDSTGIKSLEHISVETRLQTQKTYLYEWHALRSL